ncbi:hypothetical protein, partial [Leptospira fluminis]|uniref:hypothetical protein n=1 Tax=Leptospira fluminis TaxID=2484979 RepID=UPI001438A809
YRLISLISIFASMGCVTSYYNDKKINLYSHYYNIGLEGNLPETKALLFHFDKFSAPILLNVSLSNQADTDIANFEQWGRIQFKQNVSPDEHEMLMQKGVFYGRVRISFMRNYPPVLSFFGQKDIYFGLAPLAEKGKFKINEANGDCKIIKDLDEYVSCPPLVSDGKSIRVLRFEKANESSFSFKRTLKLWAIAPLGFMDGVFTPLILGFFGFESEINFIEPVVH